MEVLTREVISLEIALSETLVLQGTGKRRIELKSLILAQIERWRHALHMQVER